MRRSRGPTREGLTALLFQQAALLDIRSIEAGAAGGASPYSFHLTMDGVWYAALVLARSSDYWYKRIHLAAPERRPSLLIVWDHDSCVPVHTLSLRDGQRYGKYAASPERDPGVARNRYSAQVLLGQLLCGIQTAYDRLEHVHPSVKYRYLAKVHALSRRQRGRPMLAW